jgi:enolase
MTKILKVKARQVLDSRGNPTIQAEIKTHNGSFSSIVPSGASTGLHEAIELRDGGKEYFGKGVLKAVKNVNTIISKAIVGKKFDTQDELDKTLVLLDGTKNKSRLGANSLLSVSMAFARANAAENNMELYSYINQISGRKKMLLPMPQLNVINGGKHAGMENDIQEHMFFPAKFKTFSDSLRAGVESYHSLKNILKKKFGAQATLLGDEGGFAPKIESLEKRLELMLAAIEEAGYNGKIFLGIDCASSEFFDNGKYKIGDKSFSAEELIDFYTEIANKFKIISIEDGMAEDDWQGWSKLNAKLGRKIQIVGDDLLVTNVERINKAISEKTCNALLLKLNQIGTVSESIKASELAEKNNWKIVVSHRSGESEDPFISDLAVGLAAGQSKFGAPARSERVAKYNRLIAIEEELENNAIFPGEKLFK